MRGRGVKVPRGLLIANGILLLLALILWLVSIPVSAGCSGLDAAERWQGSGESRFSQIACFLPWDQPKSVEDIVMFRRSLDERLVQESLTSGKGSAYADAYCGEGTVTVTSDKGKASVHALGVGGEFFLFHPFDLRCGSLFSPRDLMQDRVVLDENLAWSLFGSKDVAGLTVYVQNISFVVSGVIHRDSTAALDAAFSSEEPLLIMPYDALQGLTEQGISCYEIVLPEPVSGFGRKLMEELFDVGAGEFRENSGRFSAGSLLKVAGDLDERSMVRSRVVYPFWENAVRMTETRLSVLLVLRLLCLLFPCICLSVTIIVLVVIAVKWIARKIPETIDRRIQKTREGRYAKHQ